MQRWPINTKTLTFRIIIIVILTVTISGGSLLFFLYDLFSNFVTTHIQSDMERHSSAIYSIGDQGLNRLLHKRQSANKTAIMIAKANAQDLIDEYMRANHLAGVILAQNEELYHSEDFPAGIGAENLLYQSERHLIESNSGGQKFYLYRFQFEPWHWNIILARDVVSYTFILNKIKTVYIFISLLYCLGTFLLIFYLRRNINYPVRLIIDSLEKDIPPVYKGVQEFEFLSEHIAEMMLHLQRSHDFLEKRVEERTDELRISEEKYRSIFEQSNDSIFLHDLEGRIIDANERACQLLDYSLEDLRRMSMHMLHPETEGSASKQALHETLEKGNNRFETKFLRADQTVLNVDISSRITNRDQGIIQAIIRDNTEKKLLEEERIKSSKLESIGILAGGIAHDFNNLLAGILGNINLAQMKLGQNGSTEVLKRLSACEKAVDRATNLAFQLLTFSKGGSPVTRPTPTVKLVKESISFALTGTNVTSYFTIDEDIWPVEVDHNQINQVIQNIVTNGVQAMPDGGTMMVHIENTRAREADHPPLKAGDYVRLSFTDIGPGIPDGIIDKIFDPYFSTKEKGSGLGLAICYSIIKKHKGCITVDTTSEAGSTFVIYLPASKTRQIQPEEEKTPPSHGAGKVLIMDDEEIIREMLAAALEQAGYKPVCASNGQEALTIFKEAKSVGTPFAAVILDLTVPGGMGGKEAIEHLKEIDPDVKCIVSSGYSVDPVLADYKAYGFSAMVIKPYDTQFFLSVLHDMLSSR